MVSRVALHFSLVGNINLGRVASDVMGVLGRLVLRALTAGERDERGCVREKSADAPVPRKPWPL
jgi:hypothetical protein